MRITESRPRQIIREEITVGDVRRALNYARGKKMKGAAAEVAKEAGKKAGMLGVKSVLSLFPGAAAFADAIEKGLEVKDLVQAAMSTSPEEKKKNALWDQLTIDPDTSQIVDDGVEARFVNDLSDKIAGLPDDSALPDADKQLSNWLQRNFGGAHVTKEGSSKRV